MSYRRTAVAISLGILLSITTVLAQRGDAPSSRFTPYRDRDLAIGFPDNWIVTKTGNTVTLSPEDGNVSGVLAYGLLMDIFEPRSRSSSSARSFQAEEGRRQVMLSDATDQLIEELQRTSPNLRALQRVQKEIAGQAALEVELNNTSPVGGLEVDRLITILRPNGAVRYFLAVAPQAELNRYNPIFNKMIASIRLDN
jgi:hypothetical protein